MGMFNYVAYEAPCTKCGRVLTEWQTKDQEDLLLDTVQPSECRNFYTICPGCDRWNQKRVVPNGITIVDATESDPKAV